MPTRMDGTHKHKARIAHALSGPDHINSICTECYKFLPPVDRKFLYMIMTWSLDD